MQKALILGAMSLAALATPLAAQIKPLPANPLLKQPTITVAPLSIAEVPSGVVLLPVTTGTGVQSTPSIPLRIRTTGGVGSVTLRIEVNGPNASRFSLIDPPAVTTVAGQTIVAGAASQPRSVAAQVEASPVNRLLKVSGTGAFPSVMPGDHQVTVIARESNGNEVRRSFTARFARAAAKPALAATATPFKKVLIDRSAGLTPAQLAVVPSGEVAYVPFNEVTIRPASGSAIDWHPLDAGSEVICIYGSFRYACDLVTPPPSTALPTSLTVKVPDIGRGKSVRIVLAGPHGESNAASATIDSDITTTLRQPLATGQFGGKHSFDDLPAVGQTMLLNNGDTVKCDLPYLVWRDLSVGDKVFFKAPAGALPVSLNFAGDAKVRVVSVPRGQRMRNSGGAARLESDVPTGLTNFYVYDSTYSYSTQVGECAERRR